MRLTLAAVVGALAGWVAIPVPAVAKPPPRASDSSAQATVPAGTVFDGTTVGGLSSILDREGYGLATAMGGRRRCPA